MDKYIIENDTRYNDEDLDIILETANKHNIEYKTCDIKQLRKDIEQYKDYIPIGTILFVQE